jgi:hypothetical protein
MRLSLEPRGSGPRQWGTTIPVVIKTIGQVLGTDDFLGLVEPGVWEFSVNRNPNTLILMGDWCVSVLCETG